MSQTAIILFLISQLCTNRGFVSSCQKELARCVLYYQAAGAKVDEGTLLMCVEGTKSDLQIKNGK